MGIYNFGPEKKIQSVPLADVLSRNFIGSHEGHWSDQTARLAFQSVATE